MTFPHVEHIKQMFGTRAAPNGSSIVQNFSAWFGQSKVVDSRGDPLKVYHSSTAEFTAFKRGRKDIGMHFGSAAQALCRFEERIDANPYYGATFGIIHNTIPVYLALANPLRMPDPGQWEHKHLMHFLPAEFTAAEKAGTATIADVRALIASHGYDGIVYENTGEWEGRTEYRRRVDAASSAVYCAFRTEVEVRRAYAGEIDHPAVRAYQAARDELHAARIGRMSDSWVAFDPRQIKSAWNSGLFNPKDRDFADAVADEAPARERMRA